MSTFLVNCHGNNLDILLPFSSDAYLKCCYLLFYSTCWYVEFIVESKHSNAGSLQGGLSVLIFRFSLSQRYQFLDAMHFNIVI